ncbi:hypothetical protein MnTg02_00679 [bacterium MnTg02]|nr:hypothetical protein MnTg02_00679 [bacterium MnTg02]
MKGTAKTLGAIVATAILGIAGTAVSPQIARAQKLIVKDLLGEAIVLKVPVKLRLMMPGVGYRVECRSYKSRTLGNIKTKNRVAVKRKRSPEDGAVSKLGSFKKTFIFIFKPGDVTPGQALATARWYGCSLYLTMGGYTSPSKNAGPLWARAKPGTEFRTLVREYLPGKGPG